jgi:hypothetical protein
LAQQPGYAAAILQTQFARQGGVLGETLAASAGMAFEAPIE